MSRLILIFLFFSACNSQENSSESVVKDTLKDTKQIRDASLMNGCYTSILKKDTATLKINNDNGQVSGELVYKRFEKDNNVGNLEGKILDSLIVADYTFQSEGTTSVRQVVFKISGENLIEGYGEINMNGDTATFKDIANLKYQEGQPFLKGECK